LLRDITEENDNENSLVKLVKKQKAFSEGAIPNAILLAAVTQKFGSMAIAPDSDIIKSTHPYTWAINGTIAAFATNKALGLASGVAMDRLGKKNKDSTEQDSAVSEEAQLPLGDAVQEKKKSSLTKGLEKFSSVAGSNEVMGLLYSSISQTFLLSTIAPESDPSLNGEHGYKRFLNDSISIFAAVIATGLMAGMALNHLKKGGDKEEVDIENGAENIEAKGEISKKGMLDRVKSVALNDKTDCIINSAAAARFGAAGFAPESYTASTPSAYMRTFNGIIACSAALMSVGLVATSIMNNQKTPSPEEQSENDELGATTGSSTHAKKVELTRGKRDRIINAQEDSSLSLGV